MTVQDDDEQKKLAEWRRKRQARQERQRNDDDDDDLATMMSSQVDDSDAPALARAQKRRLEQEELLQSSGSNKRGRRQKALQEMQERQKPSTAKEKQHDDKVGETASNERFVSDQVDHNAEDTTLQQESLFERASALHDELSADQKAEQQRQAEEARILREATKIQTNALQAASEVAQSTKYDKPMPSTWRPPRYILAQGEAVWQKTRDQWHMQVSGARIPPPLARFVDMKLPAPVLDCLKHKGIAKPTPIQMQGLPVALAGRDLIGIAFTGSGKSLTFLIPLVTAALEEELRMPLVRGEGPVGIVLAPSRELARQTYDTLHELATAVSEAPHQYPRISCALLIGGESVRDQMQRLQDGIHCIVATPGRLRDLLKRKAINLEICRLMVLDEADRMLDLGFDEEVGQIMNFFHFQRQTLLFSATFPKKFQDFARETLVQPIVVNVGRAGAANLDVIQEVEYVKQEAKIVYLLHCLQKTAPPVIIFCERKGDVDDIHEYLLLKGVDAVSIHGGKDQEERNEAIKLFKAGKKDVLIATDVAAKGLDFPAIQHVINFDMPAEIENYIHRIGRTGRAGKTGVATTFINNSCDETTLLDLKGLLREARQRIPPVLMMLEDPRDKNGGAGCAFCGGLGHTIVDCPKIDKDARRVAGDQRDVLAGGGDW